jgi:hypothetical protein
LDFGFGGISNPESDLVSEFGPAGPERSADVSGSDHGNVHLVSLILFWFALVVRREKDGHPAPCSRAGQIVVA